MQRSALPTAIRLRAPVSRVAARPAGATSVAATVTAALATSQPQFATATRSEGSTGGCEPVGSVKRVTNDVTAFDDAPAAFVSALVVLGRTGARHTWPLFSSWL